MGATFTRVNAVVVDPALTEIRDAYLDPSVSTSGSNSACLAQEMQTLASTGAWYRGMPALYSKITGFLVPPNAASNGTSSTTGSMTTFAGILTSDITAYNAAKGTKMAFARRGRVRSYAGGALSIGDPVKVDTSAAFSGVIKWNSGTDDPSLKIGYYQPIADGSDGNAAAVSNVQGDTIYVDLR